MSTKHKSKLPTVPTRLGKANSPTTEVINNAVEVSSNTETNITAAVEITEPVVSIPDEPKNTSYEYKVIVSRNDINMLQSTVTNHLNSGWELSGGVSCTMYADSYTASTIWSQAIYKKVSN